MSALSFYVHGRPVPQGSMRAFVTPRGTPVITPSNGAALNAWRQDIHAAATAAAGTTAPMVGPVGVMLTFSLHRPKNARAKTWQDKRPDVDKLARAALDALTGVAFGDDSQVVSLTVYKFMESGSGTGVKVSVWSMMDG